MTNEEKAKALIERLKIIFTRKVKTPTAEGVTALISALEECQGALKFYNDAGRRELECRRTARAIWVDNDMGERATEALAKANKLLAEVGKG